jgi:Zn-finger nucleic acid-binding protein
MPDSRVPATSDPQAFELGGTSQLRQCGIPCPACRAEMVFCELGTNEFAGCVSCKGMMFQQPVFARVSQRLRNQAQLPKLIPSPMDARELKVRRRCPTCGGRLETHAFCGPGNAIIDTCFPCGVIFLDAGELTKLVQAAGK